MRQDRGRFGEPAKSLFEDAFGAGLELPDTSSEAFQVNSGHLNMLEPEEDSVLAAIRVADASISSPFSARQCETLPQLRKLQQFYLLESDWDGQGADAADSEVVAAAEECARWLIENTLLPAPEPMISADGEIGLFWSVGQRYAELSFEREGGDVSIAMYARDELGRTSFFEDIYVGRESLSAEMLEALEHNVGSNLHLAA